MYLARSRPSLLGLKDPSHASPPDWKPVHIVSLGIVVLFAILNPLVIPFGLVYFAIAYPVFKSQILHVYQHQVRRLPFL
jgi:hypothetical protein